MVPPKYFDVEYSINPWMDVSGHVDRTLAQQQWENLRRAIEKTGYIVETLEPVEGQPDMVFICDSGIVYKNKVYLSKFRYAERSGEQKHQVQWFTDHGFELFGQDSELCFEGCGDACMPTPKTLWAGCGPRTDRAVYERIAKLGDFDIVLCDLATPQFFHLDTCFCPVDDKTAMWFPTGLAEHTRRDIKARLPNLIELSEKEANAFVCNSLTLGNTIISPIGITNQTVEKLKEHGFNVVQVNVSEFIKAGGACHCLVLKLSEETHWKREI